MKLFFLTTSNNNNFFPQTPVYLTLVLNLHTFGQLISFFRPQFNLLWPHHIQNENIVESHIFIFYWQHVAHRLQLTDFPIPEVDQ